MNTQVLPDSLFFIIFITMYQSRQVCASLTWESSLKHSIKKTSGMDVGSGNWNLVSAFALFSAVCGQIIFPLQDSVPTSLGSTLMGDPSSLLHLSLLLLLFLLLLSLLSLLLFFLLFLLLFFSSISSRLIVCIYCS